MSRNKIVICTIGNGGVDHYRLLSPYGRLSNDGFEIIQTNHLRGDWLKKEGVEDVSVDELLNDTVAVVFNRLIDMYGEHKLIADRIRNAGAKVILDIDDFWILPDDHLLHYEWKRRNITWNTIESIRNADIVTTTHNYLADEIKQHNKNVIVIPNAIDTNFAMYEPKPTESELVRIGWVGGICHEPDIMIMRQSMNKLWHDKALKNKWQIQLCGYTKDDNREILVGYDPAGKPISRKLKYEEHTYNIYESVFTDNYKHLTEGYALSLVSDLDELGDWSRQPYLRRRMLPIHEFAKYYNDFDIALAPLKASKFNRCKSELKMIEAGWMGKAVICSDIHPYTLIAKHEINCMVVGSENNNWYKQLKKLISQPNMRKDIALELQLEVQTNYNLDKVNKIRLDLLNHLK